MNVKKLEYKTPSPDCRDSESGVPCYCFEPLSDFKLEFYYIPNLFALCTGIGHFKIY